MDCSTTGEHTERRALDAFLDLPLDQLDATPDARWDGGIRRLLAREHHPDLDGGAAFNSVI